VSAFPARYAGRCGNCGEGLTPGDAVAYTENDVLIGQDCCGDSDVLAVIDRTVGDMDRAERVMPRGKSVRDRCGTCWQIPAANGVCGCGS
jgi:hypothetical protein